MLLVHLIYLGKWSSLSVVLRVAVWSVLWYLDETLSVCCLQPMWGGLPCCPGAALLSPGTGWGSPIPNRCLCGAGLSIL